jgi:hypothetical protein
MATAAQINANRLNAQNSTGPRSEAGKSASSRNHLTLGLYTRTDYVKPEERDFYQEFRQTMYAELSPASLLEESIVSEITGATWRLRRCNAAEADLGEYTDATDKMRRSIERARASAHSLLHRSINQLRKMKAESTKARNTQSASNCTGHAAEAATCQSKTKTPFGSNAQSASNCQGDAAAPACVQSKPEPQSPTNVPVPKLASICMPAPQTPRNALCPCRSGKKYKHCCARTGEGWQKQAA